MPRFLFVTNGHGEQAIAGRIADELHRLGQFEIDHLSLVGDHLRAGGILRPVGPARTLPSGGLVAMGNVRNLMRDLRGGLLSHSLAQLRFLGSVKQHYEVAVAVGDIFAYVMARRAAASRTAFVGTAKSVHVARYGPFEVRLLRSADAIFVRDEPTARDLQARGIEASAPGNVIVDLFEEASGDDAPALAGKQIAIFPGSRASAYADAVFACAIVRALAVKMPAIEAAISIAPGLVPQRFAQVLREDGWDVAPVDVPSTPFVLRLRERPLITAWSGSLGAMLKDAVVVLGQAGTANEAAAARGIPIAAFERTAASATSWYRERQRGLLNGALTLLRGSADSSADQLANLIADGERRQKMAAIGRERMGSAGGARAIALRLEAMARC
ncbi:MAG: hypothetical protein JO024_04685 [Candidatus Eremiobacteraeota bacterium]|nr:hypothetical protein [Candidatus Eremiobacteraeota bacterium]